MLAEAVGDDPIGLIDVDVLLVDDVEEAPTFAAIRDTLSAFVASGRQVVVVTRQRSEAYDDLLSWRENHEHALVVDCCPVTGEDSATAAEIAELVARRTNI